MHLAREGEMAWHDDQYVRTLLDGREKWGTVLSLTAIAALLLFLSEHSHRSWLNLSPMFVGALGSLYVTAVNCYYKRAAAYAEARDAGDSKANEIRKKFWFTFLGDIGFLGWMNNLMPILVGGLATLALSFGIAPVLQPTADANAQ